MNDRPGSWYKIFRFLLSPWIRRVKHVEASRKDLKPLFENGQVIFVSHSVSFIDFLVIQHALKKWQLPKMTFTHGFSPFLYFPFLPAFKEGLRNLFSSREKIWVRAKQRIMDSVAQGQNGMIYMKRSGFFSSKLEYYTGIFDRLAHHALDVDRPVYLVPVSVFLTRRRKSTKRTTWDVLFGTYDTAGRFRRFIQLIFQGKKGLVIFSKPIELTQEMRGGVLTGREPERIEKGLRRLLLWHLNNEDRAYRGPTKKTIGHKVESILKDKRLKKELEKVAERQNRKLESVQKEARKNLKEMASDTSDRMINLLRLIFDFVWARTLEGIDINPDDFERMRELNKEGPIVFLPCHRSHVDYLVFAYMFEVAGLNNPRFAAGDNLSKWPLGTILRRSGAFFIRRSFKGEVIFPLVFEAYLRQILTRRLNLTFFMEGGRSRTGKLLQPKVGMLSMVVDAWHKGVIDDIPLVPITIDYGKVFEGKAYITEKTGGEKKSENFRALLRTPKFLTKKHGVIRIRFGQPISLDEYTKSQGLSRETLGFKTKLPMIHQLGADVLRDVNRMVTITAANVLAGILLANTRGGMTLKHVRTLFVLTTTFLARRKVELAFTEKKLDQALHNALETFKNWETIVAVEVGGETVVRIIEGKRPEMEYYKNNGLHFILDLAITCSALRTIEGSWTLDLVKDRAQEIYDVLAIEFLEEPPFPEKSAIEKSVKAMSVQGGLILEEEAISLGKKRLGRDLFRISSNMLLNFLESYFIALDVIIRRQEQMPLSRKELLKLMIARGELLYAVGSIKLIESVNKVNFDNAIHRFSKLGFLKARQKPGQKHAMISINEKNVDQIEPLRDKLFQWVNALG